MKLNKIYRYSRLTWTGIICMNTITRHFKAIVLWIISKSEGSFTPLPFPSSLFIWHHHIKILLELWWKGPIRDSSAAIATVLIPLQVSLSVFWDHELYFTLELKFIINLVGTWKWPFMYLHGKDKNALTPHTHIWDELNHFPVVTLFYIILGLFFCTLATYDILWYWDHLLCDYIEKNQCTITWLDW